MSHYRCRTPQEVGLSVVLVRGDFRLGSTAECAKQMQLLEQLEAVLPARAFGCYRLLVIS
jgi:hypothetical protein